MDVSRETATLKRVLANKKLLIIILILVPMLFSIYIRSYTIYLPITDEWAYNSVYNNIRNQVTAQINTEFPNLPSQPKNELITERVAEILIAEKNAVSQQVKEISAQLKSKLQDSSGQTYLLAIDPYYWYRFAENLVETGIMGDEIRNGKDYDTYLMAPKGDQITINFHVYIEYYLYKFVSFFNRDVQLMTVVFYVPIILSALAIIPAFFITRKIAGNFGGFITAMFIAIHPAFIDRTIGGFSDTDVYAVLFPLLITWAILESLETRNLTKKIIFGTAAGFLIGLFTRFWIGWWYIYDFLLFVIIAYIIHTIIRTLIKKKRITAVLKSKTLHRAIVTFLIFIIASTIFIIAFYDISRVKNAFIEPFKFRDIKQAVHLNLWPNVYTTVAELNPASISGIVKQLLGKAFFIIASLGMILTLCKHEDMKKQDYFLLFSSIFIFVVLFKTKLINSQPLIFLLLFSIPCILGLLLVLTDKREFNIKYTLLLSIWFIGTMYASTKGVRFTLLLVPAFSVAIGIAFSNLSNIITNIIYKFLQTNKQIIKIIVIISFTSLLIYPITVADKKARTEIPSMSDAWWDTLTQIRIESEQDAIINSWWDFGHWFKAVADRRVTFDGGSQNKPTAHWIGKVLLTSDEEQAISILRMLDCGSNNAFDEVDKQFNNTIKSVEVIYELLAVDRENGKILLQQYNFDKTETQTILQYMYCEPPENYFITSGDMVSKAPVWSHFGSWDFNKAYIYNTIKNQDYQTIYELDKELAEKYYDTIQSLTTDRAVNTWIAPWLGYTTNNWVSCKKRTDTILVCNLNIRMNIPNNQQLVLEKANIDLLNLNNTNIDITIYDSTSGLVIGTGKNSPHKIIIAKETLEIIETNTNGLNIDLIIDIENNRILLADPILSTSIFTHLFYLDGKYLNHFEKFSERTSFTNQKILVWKVKW